MFDPESKDMPKLQVPTQGQSKSRDPTPSPLEPANIELNVLLKFIKPFDGSREKLNPFITNCQNAYNAASKSQKDILFKYMISQLEGTAESCCSIKEFTNFEQFIEFLKQQFGERKHYSHLLSELQDCRQGPVETVSQYALKVEKALARLLTEINISVPTKRKTEVAGRVAAMEDLALHTFVTGLNPRLSQFVRCRDPDTLNSAIGFAIAEEKVVATALARAPNRPNFEKPKFQPRREPFQPRPFFSNSGPRNANTVTCRYCKFPGHTIENCRKRQYNNNLRNQVNPQANNTNRAFNAQQVFTEYGVDEVDKGLNE